MRGIRRLLERKPVEERLSWADVQMMSATGALSMPPYQAGITKLVTHDASWACMNLLSSTVAQLPIDVMRSRGDSRDPVSTPPQVTVKASALVEQDTWLSQLMWSLLEDGNAWGRVTSVDGMGWPTTIETMSGGAVVQREVVDGAIRVHVGGEVLDQYPKGDLWHIPGPTIPPGTPFGISPLQVAKATIGTGLAAADFGAQFFADGGHPTNIIYADQEMTATQARAIKTAWINATKGTREPAVLGSGLRNEQISIAPDDSQMIETMRYTTEQVARFFGVPSTMIYAAVSGESVTYSNATQQDLAFLKYSLDRYLVRIERALTAIIPRGQVAKFNRSAILRADVETRTRVHETRLRTKTRTVNEVRAIEDESPFGGEEYDEPGTPGGVAVSDMGDTNDDG